MNTTQQKNGSSRTIDPIVSTTWLSDNSPSETMVILDVRLPDAYAEGHISGAISAPFPSWVTMKNNLMLEIPDKADLFALIGKLGITTTSKVVIVTAPNPGEPPHFGLSSATFIAEILIYAGMTDVAILDGGYPKWVSDGLPTTKEVPHITSSSYDGNLDENLFVSMEYVQSHLSTASLIDARDPDLYFGANMDPFAQKSGHIPGAISLPAIWIWEANEKNYHTFKDPALLRQMASGIVNAASNSEIIVYCAVGGFTSAWWYILSQVLRIKNVKSYNGSSQEWARHNEMISFVWQQPAAAAE